MVVFFVVACVVVVGFALGSLGRLRMLCGVGSVLVVLGTVAEVLGESVDLGTFHDLDLYLVGLGTFHDLDLYLMVGLGTFHDSDLYLVGLVLGLRLLER